MKLALPEAGRRTHTPDGVEPAAGRDGRAAARSCSVRGSGAADGAAAFARGLAAARGGAARARRRRPERARRHLEALAGRAAPTVLTPHAGELGRLLGVPSAQVGAQRLASRARGGRALGRRSSCSRATTRSSPRPNGRVAVTRGRAARAGHRRARATCSPGSIGAMLATGLARSPPRAPLCACTRSPRRPRRRRRARRRDRLRRGRRAGPRADRRRARVGFRAMPQVARADHDRRPGRPLRATVPLRARASSATWRDRRNAARLARAAPRRGLRRGEGRRLRPRRGAGRARRAGAAARRWLAVATARRGARAARRPASTRRVLVLGALSAEELEIALARGADVVAWTRVVRRRRWPARRGARVHVKLDTGMGRLGTRDPARPRRPSREAVAARRRARAGRAR